MATETKFVIPGAGEAFDFTILDSGGNEIDITGWDVEALVLDPTGALDPDDVEVIEASATARRVIVHGSQTQARAGSRAVVRAIGHSPDLPEAPVVQEYLLVIGSV